jgi:hypothetical protein
VESNGRIPGWLAINWWLLLVANLVETELLGRFHRGAVNSGASFGTWFLTVWGLLQGGWLRSVDRRSRAIFWYGAAAILDLLTVAADSFSLHLRAVSVAGAIIFFFASIAAAIIGIFVFRADMTRYFRERVDVFTLSWWMSLLFSDFYFLYHFHRIAEYESQRWV